MNQRVAEKDDGGNESYKRHDQPEAGNNFQRNLRMCENGVSGQAEKFPEGVRRATLAAAVVRQLDIDRVEAHPFEGCRNETQLFAHLAKAGSDAIRKDAKISHRPIEAYTGEHPKEGIECA